MKTKLFLAILLTFGLALGGCATTLQKINDEYLTELSDNIELAKETVVLKACIVMDVWPMCSTVIIIGLGEKLSMETIDAMGIMDMLWGTYAATGYLTETEAVTALMLLPKIKTDAVMTLIGREAPNIFDILMDVL